MALPAAQTEPLAISTEFIKFAVEEGGIDNITAVLVPFPPSGPEMLDRSEK
jgi:serine/threonine protein phosphatase PrpC